MMSYTPPSRIALPKPLLLLTLATVLWLVAAGVVTPSTAHAEDKGTEAKEKKKAGEASKEKSEGSEEVKNDEEQSSAADDEETATKPKLPDEEHASSAPSTQYIGTSAGFFFEDSDLAGEERRSVESTDESMEYNSDGFLSGGIWYLRHASESVRWGGGLRFVGSYSSVEIVGEDDDREQEEVQPYEYGELLDVYGHAEWLLPFAEQFDLVLGAQLGASLLFPDGNFERELEELEDQNVSTLPGPRWGFNVTPIVGTRYRVDERLAFRLDLMLEYQKLFLLNVEQEVDGVPFKKDWTANILRYQSGVSLEASF